MSLHNRRIRRKEEHFDRPASDILKLMQERAHKQSSSTNASGEQEEPHLMYTPDKKSQAVYRKGTSKWCPPGQWTLAQEKRLAFAVQTDDVF